MLTLYLNTVTREWFDADGNSFRDGYPQFAYLTENSVQIHLRKETPANDDATVDVTQWVVDSSFASISGIGALLTIDNDYVHKLKGELLSEVSAGSVSSVTATIDDANYAKIPSSGVVRLFDAFGNYEALSYTARSIEGTSVTFTTSGTVTGTYAVGATVDCDQAPYCSAMLKSTSSDWSNGRLLFDLVVDSERLREEMAYNDTARLTVRGLELLIYKTSEGVDVPIVAYLCDTAAVTGLIGSVGYEAAPPDAMQNKISGVVDQLIAAETVPGGAIFATANTLANSAGSAAVVSALSAVANSGYATSSAVSAIVSAGNFVASAAVLPIVSAGGYTTSATVSGMISTAINEIPPGGGGTDSAAVHIYSASIGADGMVTVSGGAVTVPSLAIGDEITSGGRLWRKARQEAVVYTTSTVVSSAGGTPNSDVIIVSGAGTEMVNGTYNIVDSAAVETARVWKHESAQLWISWDSLGVAGWYLGGSYSQQPGAPDAYYVQATPTGGFIDPPDAVWSSGLFEGGGASPMPTVAYETNQTVNSNTIVTSSVESAHIAVFNEQTEINGESGAPTVAIIADPAVEFTVLNATYGRCVQLDATTPVMSFAAPVWGVSKIRLRVVTANQGITGNVVLVPVVDGVDGDALTVAVGGTAAPVEVKFSSPVSGTLALRRDCEDSRDTLQDVEPVAVLVLNAEMVIRHE